MRILENEQLRVEIAEHGAQLSRIYDKKTGHEVIWSGDPAFWKYHAPVLFPFVGKMNGGVYRYKGREYPIGQHGFAREKEFTFVCQTEDSVTFALEDTPETRERYPFAFRLEVCHTLKDRTVTVGWKVVNPSEKEDLYFSIGAHPAFCVPAQPGEKKSDYWISFAGKEDFSYLIPVPDEGVTDPANVFTMHVDGGYLQLKEHLFDIDTYIYENGQVEEVSLCYPDRSPYVTVRCKGFPYVGLWTKSDDAPFVCLEPWYGRLDNKGFTGELPEKEGIRRLEPQGCFEAAYEIIVG